ncbi:glyoxylate/hydroxypyruvate reductase A [Pseudomonas sp. dw_358]|uniref:2-hydroxyacid dehydrogenase n=1 Tax=Pseudomonas sp. dw_358 TaxID=2720083 RepID=UPI001BD69603|nr:glyoxylate/hydroxypyruvate reductase A [Pseudomonas sp. dw_358]
MTLLYKADTSRGLAWQALFAQHAPDIEVRLWPDVGDPADIRYLFAWQPPEQLQDYLPSLEVVFATSAGIDQFDLAALPPQIPVVRMLDPGIPRAIVEYTTFAVLALHRDMPLFLHQQQRRLWQTTPSRPATERRVGVMGLGNLGRAVLEHLQPYDFTLRGWARSAQTIPGVECFAGAEQLHEFLGGCDILICLLPLTADTRHILAGEAFAALPEGAALINLGRGGHVNETDLLSALDSGHLRHAVLDVLEQEPPPPAHPFWQHPKVWLTPHCGAVTLPQTAFTVLLENIRRFQRGEAMVGLVDRIRGY